MAMWVGEKSTKSNGGTGGYSEFMIPINMNQEISGLEGVTGATGDPLFL